MCTVARDACPAQINEDQGSVGPSSNELVTPFLERCGQGACVLEDSLGPVAECWCECFTEADCFRCDVLRQRTALDPGEDAAMQFARAPNLASLKSRG